jgi:hypothetical protein
MRFVRCLIARSAREVADAQQLRWKVFGEEEGLLAPSRCCDGREIDLLDELATTLHFVAYSAEVPVGTVRLVLPSGGQERTRCRQTGLDLATKFDLGVLRAGGMTIAEVTRFCILRQFRRTRVAPALFAALSAESGRRGISHFVAGANMETDFAEDAALVYRLVRERGLASRSVRVEPLADRVAASSRGRPFYTEEQRRRVDGGDLTGIDLPGTLALFASKMGATYIGPPAYDPYFGVFALPLLAAVAGGAFRLRAATRAIECCPAGGKK